MSINLTGTLLIQLPVSLGELWFLRQTFEANINKAKSCYTVKLVKDFTPSNNAKIYSHIRSISKYGQLPSKMFFNDTAASSDLEKANIFNQYFFFVYSAASVCDYPTSTAPFQYTLVKNKFHLLCVWCPH